jgi:hypothetical protein
MSTALEPAGVEAGSATEEVEAALADFDPTLQFTFGSPTGGTPFWRVQQNGHDVLVWRDENGTPLPLSAEAIVARLIELRDGPTVDEQLEAAEKARRKRADSAWTRRLAQIVPTVSEPRLVTDLVRRCRGVSREQRPTARRVRRTTRARSAPGRRSSDDPSPEADIAAFAASEGRRR